MGRVALLGVLLVGAALMFIGLNASTTEVQQTDPLAGWDMQQEIQKASETERNPWKRKLEL